MVCLSRCHSEGVVRLVSSTYISRGELLATYATAAQNLKELEGLGVSVLHGIDATSLSSASKELGKFDHVIFSHPHLGLVDLGSEDHRRRHVVLIAHFFQSAQTVLKKPGYVHLGLCGRQPATWNVEENGLNSGLRLVGTSSSTNPGCFFVGQLKNRSIAAVGPGNAA